MSVLAPDADGFIAAQDLLRTELGSPITFRIPNAPEWPEGTKLNPDTGEPYDATVQPGNAEYSELTKTCLPILKQASPLRPQPDTQFSPAGELSGMDIIIDIADEDFADVKEAVEVVYMERVYRVVEIKPFEIAGKPYRYLMYGEET